MNKYDPYKNKEEVLEVIKYLKDKLNRSTNDFDIFYLNFRIEMLEEMLKEN